MSERGRVSEAPATQMLGAHGVSFTEHPYESTILDLPRIEINGGRRGYLVGMEPVVCTRLLGAKPVQCALAE